MRKGGGKAPSMLKTFYCNFLHPAPSISCGTHRVSSQFSGLGGREDAFSDWFAMWSSTPEWFGRWTDAARAGVGGL